MSLRKLLDSDVQILIELRKNEHALWDVTFPKYFNVDVGLRMYFGYVHTLYITHVLPTYDVVSYFRTKVRTLYVVSSLRINET